MEYISRISSKQTKNIEDTIIDFERYWNLKDSQKFGTLFTENAEFTDIMGQVAVGKKQIEEMQRIIFENFMKNAVLNHNILYIRNISEESIMATCKWKTLGHSNDTNDKLPERKGIIQIIFHLIEDKWLISLVQNFDFTALYNNIDNYTMKYFNIDKK